MSDTTYDVKSLLRQGRVPTILQDFYDLIYIRGATYLTPFQQKVWQELGYSLDENNLLREMYHEMNTILRENRKKEIFSQDKLVTDIKNLVQVDRVQPDWKSKQKEFENIFVVDRQKTDLLSVDPRDSLLKKRSRFIPMIKLDPNRWTVSLKISFG